MYLIRIIAFCYLNQDIFYKTYIFIVCFTIQNFCHKQLYLQIAEEMIFIYFLLLMKKDILLSWYRSLVSESKTKDYALKLDVQWSLNKYLTEKKKQILPTIPLTVSIYLKQRHSAAFLLKQQDNPLESFLFPNIAAFARTLCETIDISTIAANETTRPTTNTPKLK